MLNELRKGQHQERTATPVTLKVQTLASTGQLPPPTGCRTGRGRPFLPNTGRRTVRTGERLVRTGRRAASTGRFLPRLCRRTVPIGEDPPRSRRRQRLERRYAM